MKVLCLFSHFKSLSRSWSCSRSRSPNQNWSQPLSRSRYHHIFGPGLGPGPGQNFWSRHTVFITVPQPQSPLQLSKMQCNAFKILTMHFWLNKNQYIFFWVIPQPATGCHNLVGLHPSICHKI